MTEGTTTPAVSNSNSNVIRNSEPSSNDSYSGNNATGAPNDQATTQEEQEVVSETPTISLQTTTFNVGNIPAGGFAFITPTVPSYSAGGTIQNLDLEILQ